MIPSAHLATSTTVNFSLSSGVQLAFLFLAAFYIIFSGILYYHWQQYGTDKSVTWFTLLAYIATTVPLMIALGVLALIV
ncbi:hypothetical protein KC887_06615 [Candidatus Kaiserbacteria bacterium]|nr:hypothetical protein [Candidatus Kaiserbacteria bacterium]